MGVSLRRGAPATYGVSGTRWGADGTSCRRSEQALETQLMADTITDLSHPISV